MINQELQFSVAYVSSQTEQNPATKLINAGPYSEGWLSIPNTRFPQELVLDFGSTVGLTELTFVSHQCKIASSIVLLAGKDASNFKKAKFQQLDTFQFSDNRQKNYKARESLRCHLPGVRLRYLKLLIEEVYQNNFNRGNQVGIVSIVANGFPIDINTDDPEIARLEKQKKDAVDIEDYDLAGQIKSKIDNIINNKALLDDLNKQKKEAVDREDFNLAAQIQKQIMMITSGNNMRPPPNQNKKHNKQGGMGRFMQEPYDNFPDQNRMRPSGYPEQNQYQDMNDPNQYQDDFQHHNNPYPPSNFNTNYNSNYNPNYNPYPQDQGNFPANKMNFQENYDNPPFNNPPVERNYEDLYDRPIKPAKNGEYEYDENAYPADDLYSQTPMFNDDRPIKQSNQEDLIDVKQVDDYENDRIEPPEELTDQTFRKEAQMFIEYGYENTVKYFYSKNPQNKIRGIKDVADIVRNSKPNVQQQLYMKYCHMIKLPLRAKLPTIFSRAVQELMDLTDSIPRLSPDNIRQALDGHIPTIVRNLGRKEQLAASSAIEFIRWAAEKRPLGVNLVISHLIAPSKTQIQSENHQVRLELLDELLAKTNDQSIDYQEIYAYLIDALTSKKIEIRNASCKVIKTLSMKGHGPAISKLLQSANLSSATLKTARKAIAS